MATKSRIKNLDHKIKTGEFSSQDIRLIRSNFMPHTFNEILANYKEQNSAVVNSLAAIAAIDTIRGSKTRRIFLKYSLLIGSAFIINSCSSSGSDNNTDNTPTEIPDRTFNMRFIVKDIFTGADLPGAEFSVTDYSGNAAKDLRHGDTVDIFNGIDDLVMNVLANYRLGYIVVRHPGTKELLFAKDNEGHEGVNLKTGYSHIPDSFDAYVYMIPSDFDTETLASCVGKNITTTNDSFGDGTIQRYIRDYEAGEIIRVAFWENVTPGANTYEIAEKVHRRVNQGSAINVPGVFGVRLTPYEEAVMDQVESYIQGCTVKIDDIGAGNRSEVNNRDEVTSSVAKLGIYDPNEGAHVEEFPQATLGILRDGGEKRNPYFSAIKPFPFINDAYRAGRLIQLLPCGFKLSYGSRTP